MTVPVAGVPLVALDTVQQGVDGGGPFAGSLVDFVVGGVPVVLVEVPEAALGGVGFRGWKVVLEAGDEGGSGHEKIFFGGGAGAV